MQKREYNYWKKEIQINGSTEWHYAKTGVWQTRPSNMIEISEDEFIKSRNIITKTDDE